MTVAVATGVAVAVAVMAGLAVGEGDGSEAVPMMRRKTALAKPPRLPVPSMEYVPAGPTGTVNVPEAVPVDDATIPLATVRDEPGAVRKRIEITSPAAKPRKVKLIV